VLAVTAGFGLVALCLLIWRGAGAPLGLATGAIIYGVTLAISAVCSLVYNIWFHDQPRSLWRLADHIAIFLLIAGTYTPLSLGGAGGRIIWLLPPIWTVAVVGSLLKIMLGLRYERWFVFLYLAMGWMVVGGLGEMIASFEPRVVVLIVAGGLAFSVGTIFHTLGRRWAWGKAAWHVFVLTGITTHFVAIFSFVLPMG
jgi:hemolysin III